jgi:hypothetical protein
MVYSLNKVPIIGGQYHCRQGFMITANARRISSLIRLEENGLRFDPSTSDELVEYLRRNVDERVLGARLFTNGDHLAALIHGTKALQRSRMARSSSTPPPSAGSLQM